MTKINQFKIIVTTLTTAITTILALVLFQVQP